MVLTEGLPKVMNNINLNKNLNNIKIVSLDWSTIQSQMKTKLGLEIYERWLKKIRFVEEFNNYILSLRDLSEIG